MEQDRHCDIGHDGTSRGIDELNIFDAGKVMAGRKKEKVKMAKKK